MRYYIGAKRIEGRKRAECNRILRRNFSRNTDYGEYKALTKTRRPTFSFEKEQNLFEYFYHREWYYLTLDLDSRIIPKKVLNKADLTAILKFLEPYNVPNYEYRSQLKSLKEFFTLLIKRGFCLFPHV